MIIRLAIRSLLARPVRSAVLIGGFGLGVAVMAVLLGVGRVVLEQARAPQLRGGGDVVIAGASGQLANAPYILSTVLRTPQHARDVVIAAPNEQATVYLVSPDGKTNTPVRARGGVPSLERALRDPETSGIASWTDTAADRAWTDPNPDDVLRQIDRFHSVPDVPARASSWAEWLYFNGRSDAGRFYLTFMAGPLLPTGKRTLGVRLQLDRGGVMTNYSAGVEVDAAELLSAAPNIAAGTNSVRLVGHDYHLALDLRAESGPGHLTGTLVLTAQAGRSFPPFVIRGARGWVSGYVVPVMAGTLRGSLQVDGQGISFEGGAGYHDHNWGFWRGVSWQWGQVQHDRVSLVYGRVHPPADAADASRVPGFIVALGPDGPIGFATNVQIEETNPSSQTGNAEATAPPTHIVVRGRGETLNVTMDLTVGETTATRMRQGAFDDRLDFLQMRANYRVTGQAGDTPLEFEAPGSAETFRGRESPSGK